MQNCGEKSSPSAQALESAHGSICERKVDMLWNVSGLRLIQLISPLRLVGGCLCVKHGQARDTVSVQLLSTRWTLIVNSV